jgi:hypothetical protein
MTLERWKEHGTVEVGDPERMRAMADRLVRDWGAFVPEELPPSQEAREWSEVSGGDKSGKDTRKPRRR